MGETHIRPNGVGRVHVKPGGGGGHVQMSAGSPGNVHVTMDRWWGVQFYPDPNPGLTQALISPQMSAVVTDYTQKVAVAYRQMLGARSRTVDEDEKGNRIPGGLFSTIQANVLPNQGFKNDRWIGEVTVGNAKYPYGAADEFGRKNPDAKQRGSTYDGSGELAKALYSVLPKRI